ncbi:MAG: glycosyltransferase [bacterium]|nr:glycosyltransferase [bacterium]
MKASVIISFFNKFDVLKIVLAGFERQSFKEFEIIIADDGSESEVVKKITNAIEESTLTIHHVWHENKGWRKNSILNEAITRSSSEYLIFIDGDCIPHKDFVLDHLTLKQAGQLLTGRRVRMSEKVSSHISLQSESGSFLNSIFTKILWDGIFGKTIQVEKGVAIKLPGYKNKKLRKNPKRQVLGCNFSIHKEELVELNGFDERYQGPGIGEDIDIDLRYTNSGGKVMLLRNCAILYHLYHPKIERHSVDHNLEIFNEHKLGNVVKTNFGLTKKGRT